MVVLPWGTNASFIALIAKVDDPQSLGDFRPISLVRFMYKIVAKLLTKRLKKVLPGVIDQWQSAFLGNRYLLHGVLVTNEVIEEARSEKKKCLVF